MKRLLWLSLSLVCWSLARGGHAAEAPPSPVTLLVTQGAAASQDRWFLETLAAREDLRAQFLERLASVPMVEVFPFQEDGSLDIYKEGGSVDPEKEKRLFRGNLLVEDVMILRGVQAGTLQLGALFTGYPGCVSAPWLGRLLQRIPDSLGKVEHELREQLLCLSAERLKQGDFTAVDEILEGFDAEGSPFPALFLHDTLESLLDRLRFLRLSGQLPAEPSLLREERIRSRLALPPADAAGFVPFLVESAVTGEAAGLACWERLVSAAQRRAEDVPSPRSRAIRLDFNRAPESELALLSSLGAEGARRMAAFREQGGSFREVPEVARFLQLAPRGARELDSLGYCGLVPPPTAEWTVMIYFCGDGDLEIYGVSELLQLEAAGESPQINVLFQLDRVPGPGIKEPIMRLIRETWADGNWTGSRRYLLRPDRDPVRIDSLLLEKQGEIDVGSADTFEAFCRWGMAHFPARRYALFPSNHGAGTTGICFDETSGQLMRFPALEQALLRLGAFRRQLDGKDTFDFLNFWACLMGTLEAGYGVRDCAEYLFATETRNYAQSSASWLKALVADPLAPTGAVARDYFHRYVKLTEGWFRDLEMDCAYSAALLRPAGFAGLAQAFDRLVATAARLLPDATLSGIFRELPCAEETLVAGFRYDLAQLAEAIRTCGEPEEVKQTAADFLAAYGPPGTAPGTTSDTFPASSPLVLERHNGVLPFLRGLSLFLFTRESVDTYARLHRLNLGEEARTAMLRAFNQGSYHDLRFSQDFCWDDLLRKRNEAVLPPLPGWGAPTEREAVAEAAADPFWPAFYRELIRRVR